MKLTSLLGWCALLGVPMAGNAKVDCRVVCSSQQSMCLEPGASVAAHQKTPGSYRIPDCEAADRKLTGMASVWYSRKSILVTKSQPAGTLLAAVVSDADQGCPAWSCLFKVGNGSVTGANPMGSNAETAASPAVIAAGLPYEEIVLPATGIAVRLVDPSGTGALTVSHSSGSRLGTYAASKGMVLIPPEGLKTGEAYSYVWEARGGVLRGSFSIASVKTVDRAVTAANAMVPAESGADQTKLALVSVYLRVGLGWNARQLIAEMEGGNAP